MPKLIDALLGNAPIAPSDRAAAAKKLTEKCGYAAAAFTLTPIPGTEVVAVMPLHVGMVTGIGHIYGVELTRASSSKLVLRIGGTVGLSLVGSRIALTAAKTLLPGLGGLIGAPFMYASTLALGAVARAYFEHGERLDDEQMKSIYTQTAKRARQDFDPAQARSTEVQDLASKAAAEAAETEQRAEPDSTSRLEQLKDLHDRGLIEPEEYEQTKKRILDEL